MVSDLGISKRLSLRVKIPLNILNSRDLSEIEILIFYESLETDFIGEIS